MKLAASVLLVTIIISWAASPALSIRFPDRISGNVNGLSDQPLRTAVFALGSFWRSEAAFGCLDGVVRTAAGYAGGSRPNPEYRSLGDHAECVQIEYNPGLLVSEIYLMSFGLVMILGKYLGKVGCSQQRKGANTVKDQCCHHSNSTARRVLSAEPEHQKFELKRNPFLLQLIGNLPEEELEQSALATKLNGYAAELCPPRMQRQIDAKIDDIIRKGGFVDISVLVSTLPL
ncbi:Peptide methionine sulfoxide reductase A5 [Sesamum angolense]|uniref:peptide-methionine (S)-S-oxide reductase n=1 Tax=Sesamum angolense TaxID=2727404 RepID=A0AAE1WIJ3_9LAMI|nr:Peptide methionine sulfoxide reductase A5 [Sesamum angolense]